VRQRGKNSLLKIQMYSKCVETMQFKQNIWFICESLEERVPKARSLRRLRLLGDGVLFDVEGI
jgi:hypothetical protein